MTNTSKTGTKWRWLKRGLFAVAVLITLAALAVVFENWRGRRAWANYRAELEAKGEVLDWQKLVPQNIPDDQNFAKTPLLAPLMDYHRDPNTGELVLANPAAKQRVSSMFAWSQKLKTGNWRQGRETDWTKIQSELRSQTNSTLPEVQALLKRPAGTLPDDVLFLFSFNKAEMDEISAAARRPYSSFGTRLDEGFDVLMPQLAAVRSLARGFYLKTLAELAATNTEAALADWKTSVALGDALNGDPVLISLLVKLAVIDLALNPVWEGLDQHRWSDPQLVEIQATLENLNLVADAKRAFEGERAYVLIALDQLMQPNGSRSMGQSRVFRTFLLPGWVAQNKIWVCRTYEKSIFELFDTERRSINVARADSIDQGMIAARAGFHPYRAIARMVVPTIGNVVLQIANAQMDTQLAAVACSLERYRDSEGKYPVTLKDLVPRFIESIPADLDEKPLRYELQSDGSFILYSIGVDLKDDHGRIGKPDGTFTTDEGDWVWKYPKAGQ